MVGSSCTDHTKAQHPQRGGWAFVRSPGEMGTSNSRSPQATNPERAAESNRRAPGKAISVMWHLILTRRVRFEKRVWRALPAALLAVGLVTGLAAAATHSVHHLGKAQGQQPECLGVLAWAAGVGTDGPASAVTLDPPTEIDRISHPGSTLPPPVSVATPLGRAPPPRTPPAGLTRVSIAA